MTKRGKAAVLKGAIETAAAGPPSAAEPVEPALLPEVVEPVRRGRPTGALSRRTRDFLAYLDARPDLELPGIWLARRFSAPVETILAEVGLPNTPEHRRWADEQRQDAAKALAPYVHERRPQALQLEDRRTISLTVQALDAAGAPVEDALAGEIDLGALLLPRRRDGADGDA
jgi:hypothetical protein